MFRGTTILAVRRDGILAMAGDGQVTMGNTIVKGSARKVRRLHDGNVLAGFAGSTADAMTLFDKFERIWRIQRQSVQVCSRTRKGMANGQGARRLEALLIVADRESEYIVSGSGDVVEPDSGGGHRIRRTVCAGSRRGADGASPLSAVEIAPLRSR